MMKLLWIIIITLLLDFIFLHSISYDMNKSIRRIQGTDIKINIIPMIIVYIFIWVQIYYFIILQNNNILYAFILGSTTYGIFDMTNMSIFTDWNYKLAIIDTLWGGILYALTTFIVNRIH